MADFDSQVKQAIYQTLADTGSAPTSTDVAAVLGRPAGDVEGAFAGLAAQRLLVLEPGTTTRIRMAPPFSGVATPHRVTIDHRSYYANCAWDAFGIAAALHRDANVFSTCADCGGPIALEIRDGRPVPQECVVHFAVPAAHWWDDIIYT